MKDLNNNVCKCFSYFLLRSFWKTHWKRKIIITVVLIITIFFWFSIPRQLFNDPYSTVLLDRDGELLGAKISVDGQWRFPEISAVPYKFKKSLIEFEDQYFFYHPGINAVSIFRAMYQDISKKKIVSGGSTITMQVVRLIRKNHERTFWEKFIEMIMALRLELTYSKSEILELYASHAPFGGNVVGLDAAAWRYFGVSPDKLSWAESATIAILPNSPTMIYPGKNRTKLFDKRNRLLKKLFTRKIIDKATYELSINEPLPNKPFPLPQVATHLLEKSISDGHRGEKIKSTLSIHLQEAVNRIIEENSQVLAANKIFNAAALVLDVNTGNVLAYVGNSPQLQNENHAYDVDVICSPRSTGSILKPYLFAGMLNDGLILPTTLIPDVPMQIGGFVPENYYRTFDGAVPAKHALSRSLNIPAVKMLQSYGVEKFYGLLKKLGMTTLTRPADHYGLTLILGGAEAKLWDLAGIYASMARTLNHFSEYNGKYNKDDFRPPSYVKTDEESLTGNLTESSLLNAPAIWQTFESMVEVSRPDEDQQWQQFSSSSKVAWKTGTSFGNRDGWAIGITPNYVVAVWVGNATGEGRPGLTGLGTAAPVLFDIFKFLRPVNWFKRPTSEMTEISVCRYSGYRASSICEYTDKIWVSKKALKTPDCPYHIIVHLDKSGKYQVSSNCESTENMTNLAWFVLPPVQEFYYKSKNPFYKILPPFRVDCISDNEMKYMDMIYPANKSILYIPIDIDGKPGSVIFKLAHRNPQATVYWSLDGKYLGSTTQLHQMELRPDPGPHKLNMVDQNGESLNIKFTIEGKKK
jgi:penicillin-binding protein 1C